MNLIFGGFFDVRRKLFTAAAAFVCMALLAVTGVTALHILEDAIGDLEPRPSQGLVAIHIH